MKCCEKKVIMLTAMFWQSLDASQKTGWLRSRFVGELAACWDIAKETSRNTNVPTLYPYLSTAEFLPRAQTVQGTGHGEFAKVSSFRLWRMRKWEWLQGKKVFLLVQRRKHFRNISSQCVRCHLEGEEEADLGFLVGREAFVPGNFKMFVRRSN